MTHAFLQYRDPDGRQRIHTLDTRGPVVVGRTSDADLVIGWDDRVSRHHARLELVGDDPASDWTVVDDKPSRNGTFVNGKRVKGRVRLSDGDHLTFADTPMQFRAAPGEGGALPAPAGASGEVEPDSPTMIISAVRLTRESLSDGEQRVLEALARSPAASDEEIARRIYLGVATLRRTLDGLYARLGLDELPEEDRRHLLLEQAKRSGVV